MFPGSQVLALILICSIYVPPDPCDAHHAIDVNRRELPFGIMGLAGRVEMADSARGPDLYHYQKIVQVR